MALHAQVSNNYRLDCFINVKKYYSLNKQPIIQLDHNCTNSTIPLHSNLFGMVLFTYFKLRVRWGMVDFN